MHANWTSLYHGNLLIDGPQAAPGTDLEGVWDTVPAHSAVAITDTLTATAAAGSTVLDPSNRLLMPYLGQVNAPASPIGVRAGDSPGGLFYAEVGVPLHHFTLRGTDVFLLEVGGGNVITSGTSEIVQQGSGTIITQLDGRQTVTGPSASLPVGNTNAAYLLAHEFDAASLASAGTLPARVLVPDGCTFLAPAGVTLAAAGSSLLNGATSHIISDNSAGLIAQDGGGVISSDGAGVVSSDGAGLIGQDGGGIVSHDGGGIISHDGGGVLSSRSGTSGILSTYGGGIVATGTADGD